MGWSHDSQGLLAPFHPAGGDSSRVFMHAFRGEGMQEREAENRRGRFPPLAKPNKLNR